MKRILSLFFAVVMIFTAMPLALGITASAEKYDGFEYSINYYDQNTVNITKIKNTANVKIPGKIDGKTVTGINWDAFNGCSKIKTLYIPSGVTNLAYYNITGYCHKLEKVTVSSKNKNYSSYDGMLFDKPKTSLLLCPRAKAGAAKIPGTVTYLSGYEFYYCKKITAFKVVSTNKNHSSAKGLLYNKKKTELICCPKGITGKIVVPDSVKSIDSYAFAYCSKITSIHIGSGVKDMNGINFSECDSLKKLTVSSKNKYYSSDGKALYNKKKTVLLTALPTCKTFKVPSSVKTIEWYAFAENSNLKSVNIPNTVTKIAYLAFYGCSNLTSVKLPNKLKKIEDATFSECSKLKSITIPKSVTKMESPFFGCNNLSKIYYGGTKTQWNKIERIGYNDYVSELVNRIGFGDVAKKYYNSSGCKHKYSAGADLTCNTCGYFEINPVMRKVKGTWYYYNNGVKDTSNTLVKHTNGKLYHVKGGKWVKDTAIVKYNGKRYYVKKGLVRKVTETVKVNGKKYKVKNGIVV